jgi:hypothetical protein
MKFGTDTSGLEGFVRAITFVIAATVVGNAGTLK